jgi:molybdate transport system regulatory protein
LEKIDQTGSLKAAANLMSISYRKAWGDLSNAEKVFGVPLVIRQRGGSGGGETHLTEEGRYVLAFYKELRETVEKTLNDKFNAMLHKLETNT